MLIKRVSAGTEYVIGEEQCGFRQGRGWIDQVFAETHECEKYLANRKYVFWTFMDLIRRLIQMIGLVCGRY